MTLAHLYKDFGGQTNFSTDFLTADGQDYETDKLQAFEEGYQAGWDDSVKAQNDLRQQISSDLANNLQEISFSFHEARNSLTQGLKPLFEEIITKVLPEIAYNSLGCHIIEQLHQLAQTHLDQIIEVNVSPDDYEILETLLDQKIKKPFVLLAQSEIGKGQVYLRIGDQEREIDFANMIEEIQNSIANLFEQEQNYG